MSYSIAGLSRYEKIFAASNKESAEKLDGVRNRFAEQYAIDSDELRTERSKNTNRDANKGIVQDYYAIATDLYEYGWGESFHFGIRWKDSTFEDAIRRYAVCSAAGVVPIKRSVRYRAPCSALSSSLRLPCRP